MVRHNKFWKYILKGENKDVSMGDFLNGFDSIESKIDFYVFNKITGEPRWVFPSTLRSPLFLKFYPVNTLRSKLMKFMLNLIFHVGLIRLFTQKVTVGLDTVPNYFDWLIDKSSDQFAFFTGTVGPNRKVILYQFDEKGKGVFTKIPFGPNSVDLIKNEKIQLSRLMNMSIKSFVSPQLLDSPVNCLSISEIEMSNTSSVQLTDISQILTEMYSTSLFSRKYGGGIDQKRLGRGAFDLRVSSLMEDLRDSILKVNNKLIELNPSYHMAFSHGDFTPWNMASNDKVHLLDWEMAGEYPALFDLFHYQIQGDVMLRGMTADKIIKSINRLMDSSDVSNLLVKYNLDWKIQLNMYLLEVSSYYYYVYSRQGKVHKQGCHAMKVWSELLVWSEAFLSPKSHRKMLVKEMFEYMSDKKYALMKHQNLKLSEHSEGSDLDIAIDLNEVKSIVTWLSNHSYVTKIITNKTSFMTVVTLFFQDGSFLSIDLIFKMKRCHLEYLSVNEIIKTSQVNEEGVKLPLAHFDLQYIVLFYFLNHAIVPEKYRSYFEDMTERRKRSVFQYLKFKLKFKATSVNSLFNEGFQKFITEDLSDRTIALDENRGLKGFFNRLGYVYDVTRSFFSNNGMVLSFSGVDGAGKSTVIKEVKSRLEDKFRKKVVVLRHRPSMMPILSAWLYGKKGAEKRSMASLPRQGKNSNPILSLLRFAYYLVDYVVGQFIIKIKYTSRGSIVLYDRYYFDFIEDARRTNISLPKSFIKLFYMFVYKPEINVFLYAQPDEILRRKKELSKEDIILLTQNYRNLFLEFNIKYDEQYVLIENTDLPETVSRVESLFFNAA